MRSKSFRPIACPLEERVALSGNLLLDDPGVHSYQEGQHVAVQMYSHEIVHYPALNVFYGLEPGAPQGAVINAVTGLFQWDPPARQAVYNVGIRVQDDGDKATGLTTSVDVKTLTLMVFDNAPSVNAGVNTTIAAGDTLSRVGSFNDVDADTWRGRVDYGDGSGEQTLTLNPDKSFALAHRYSAPGSYAVVVTVDDSQGGQGRGRFGVSVVTTSQTPPPNLLAPSSPASTPTPTPPTQVDTRPTYFVNTPRQLRNLARNRPRLYHFLIQHDYRIVVVKP
jgi:hypothetical protein